MSVGITASYSPPLVAHQLLLTSTTACMEIYHHMHSAWLQIYFSAKKQILPSGTWMFNGRVTDMIVDCLPSLMPLHYALELTQPLSHLNNQKCESISWHAWRGTVWCLFPSEDREEVCLLPALIELVSTVCAV